MYFAHGGAWNRLANTSDGLISSSLQFDTITSPFTGSFTGSFKGTFLDQLGETGSADQILVTDGSGGLNYKTFALPENTGVQPAAANKFSISWQDNLNFTASAASVYIAGEDTPRSQLGEKNITLAPADSTHPRFDVFIFSGSATDTSSGSIEVVQGTASANPIYPDVDPGNEVPLKFVLIKAGAVIPSDGSNENDTSGADFAESTVFSDNANDGNSWKSFGSSATSANITTTTGAYGASNFDQFDYGNTLYGNAIKWPRTGAFQQRARSNDKDRFGFWHPNYNVTGSGLTLGTLDALEFDLKMPSSVTGSYYWQTSIKKGYYSAYFHINLTEADHRNSDGTISRVAPAAFARVNFKDFVDLSRDDFQKISIPANSFQGTGNGGAGSKIILIDGYLYKRVNQYGPFPPAGDGLYIKNLRWVDGSGTPVQLDPTGDSISNATANTTVTITSGQLSGSFSGSFQGDGSNLTGVTATLPAGVVSSSLQFDTITSPFTGSFTGSFTGDGTNITGVTATLPAGVVSSSLQFDTITSPFTGSFTGSFQGDGTNITGVTATLPDGIVSSSLQFDTITSPFTGSFTGSFTGDGSGLTGVSGQGFPFNGDAVISGSLTVSGSTPTGTSFTLENGHVVLAQVSQSLNYPDDTAAASGGVPLGGLYRSGNFIAIRLT